MSDRHVDVEGRRIYIREHGNGAPLVLLHGFPQTGEAWKQVADKLSGRNRVFVPDLPGFGRSDAAVASDMQTVSRTLVRALAAAGAEKFALVGHDWGGSIALRIALDHPQAVEKLVVVNAPFRSLDLTRGWHFLAFNVPLIPEAAMVLFGKRLVPMLIKAGSKNKQAFDAETMKGYGEAFSDLGHARSTLAYYRTITRSTIMRGVRGALDKLPVPMPGGRGTHDNEAGPRRVQVPTLIVWGERDPVLPPSLIPTIERDVDDVTVVRLPDIGHFVPEEAPSELAHEIDRFLNPHRGE
ncbi:MAG TPA: alpha/beta hydrolase [Actinomycetota bacterium]|nr:alpha/beta hydrolase [Actinomycetota bacterium]